MSALQVPDAIGGRAEDYDNQGRTTLYNSIDDASDAIEAGNGLARRHRITTSAGGNLAGFDPVWVAHASGNGARHLITWPQRENGTRHVLTVEGPLP